MEFFLRSFEEVVDGTAVQNEVFAPRGLFHSEIQAQLKISAGEVFWSGKSERGCASRIVELYVFGALR